MAIRKAAVYDDPDYRPPEDSWAMQEGLWDVPADEEIESQPPPVQASHDQPAGSNQDPAQFTKDTNRWSYHLANDPYGGAAGQWARSFYDNPNIDPGAAIQDQIRGFRGRYGSLADAGDVEVMEMIATGKTPQPQNQSPTQAWTTQTTQTTPTVPTTPPATPTPGVGESGDELLALLMGRARQASAVGRDDPNVRAQVDPMTAQMERASREYLDTAAERAGGSPYNMDAQARMVAERQGQASGQLESQVIGREIGARREEIQQALTQWGDMLSGEQKLALERELGYLNNQTANRSIDVDYETTLRELALRQWIAENSDYYRRSGI